MAADQNTPVALVTGATYGVGAAAAAALAADGHDIVLTGQPGGDLSATAAKIEALGRRALPLGLDLRSQDSIEEVVDRTLKEFGRLDVLVNNAGTILNRPAIDITRAEWSAIVDVNITGTFFMTQRVGRHMIESGQPGAIVSVSSVHAIIGVPMVSAYGISKAAVSQMTRMLAVEWAEHGIRVNAVAPGRLITESPARAKTTNDPAYIAKMTAAVPMRRLATVEEVAGAISYLASPRAGSITGQVLVLDGGLTVA
jgi:NAD(P)-dependent dehydrogenase (short-subunit alcohol dehydrogenase family)